MPYLSCTLVRNAYLCGIYRFRPLEFVWVSRLRCNPLHLYIKFTIIPAADELGGQTHSYTGICTNVKVLTSPLYFPNAVEDLHRSLTLYLRSCFRVPFLRFHFADSDCDVSCQICFFKFWHSLLETSNPKIVSIKVICCKGSRSAVTCVL